MVGVPDPYRGETVKAFVALKPGASATAEELVAHCRDQLAAYKYPRQVELVAELPKTPTGKSKTSSPPASAATTSTPTMASPEHSLNDPDWIKRSKPYTQRTPS